MAAQRQRMFLRPAVGAAHASVVPRSRAFEAMSVEATACALGLGLAPGGRRGALATPGGGLGPLGAGIAAPTLLADSAQVHDVGHCTAPQIRPEKLSHWFGSPLL